MKIATAPALLSSLSLAGLLLVVGIIGYVAFLFFVKGILAPKEFAAYGLAFTAVAAATASFFSPCSFTVLPGYLAFSGSHRGVSTGVRLHKTVVNGLVAALGVITTVAILGAVIGALGTSFAPKLSILGPDPSTASKALRYSIGALLAFLGLLHILNLSHRIPLVGRISTWAIQMEGDSSPSLRSIYLYGVGYIAVGIGWVAPFLAAVAAFALTSGGFFSAFLAFLLFAGTMGVLMLLVSLLAGLSQHLVLRQLRASSSAIQRVSGLVLVLVGAGLIYFTVDVGTFQSLFFPS